MNRKSWRAEVPKFRCSGDAERVSENLESQSYEIPMFRRCGEGFRKSGEPKLRNSHVPAMRRGSRKIIRAKVTKFPCSGDAERVSKIPETKEI